MSLTQQNLSQWLRYKNVLPEKRIYPKNASKEQEITQHISSFISHIIEVSRQYSDILPKSLDFHKINDKLKLSKHIDLHNSDFLQKRFYFLEPQQKHLTSYLKQVIKPTLLQFDKKRKYGLVKKVVHFFNKDEHKRMKQALKEETRKLKKEYKNLIQFLFENGRIPPNEKTKLSQLSSSLQQKPTQQIISNQLFQL